MNIYEGLYIFNKALNEEECDAALNEVRKEIEKAGGEVQSTTRLGKRGFARPMKKQDAGYYAVMVFAMQGDRLVSVQARLKRNEKLLRSQVVRAQNPPAQA